MTSKVPYKPDGYQSVIPYLHVNGAAKLITFLKEVFEAKEIAVYARPDGTVGHAALRIGDSVVELADGGEQWPAMPCALQIYVPDTDAAYHRALKAGASSLQEPANQFYGDRIASVSLGPLSGARVLDARGLVVAPGFVDLHQHQQDAPTYRLKALDGVTTALELEMGSDMLAGYFEYDQDLFERSTIESLSSDFGSLLAAIAADPDTPILALAPTGRPRPRPARTISRTSN